MKKIILFSFILSLLSCAQRPSLKFEPSTKKKAEAGKNLTEAEVFSDIQYVNYAIRNAYSGYFFKNKKALDEGMAKLESLSRAMTTQELCDAISSSFKDVKDRHLSFRIGRKKCGYKRIKANVGSRKFLDRKKLWTVDELKRKGKKILYITIAYFPSSSSPKWNGFIDTVKRKLGKSDVVFIDLRGNGGGDDTVGYQLAKVLAGGKDVDTPYGDQYKITTREGLQNAWNPLQMMIYRSKTDKEKKYFEKYIDSELRTYWGKGKATSKRIIRSKKKLSYKNALKPIYILQDRRCASSCESTIDFFEYIKPVYRIGENTAGFIHFGNVGFVMLPNSFIQANLPSTFNTYLDGRFVEYLGIDPDIRVEKGNDAYDTALKHLSSSTQ